MAEISISDDPPQAPGRPPAPARPPVQEISQWVERFSIMAAILCTRFPEKAPELWAYQATIVRAERNYEGKRWVTYDRQFRRQALAKKDLNWSVTDPRLYNEAFTGRARSIARCNFCLQDDHLAANCPHNPHRPYFGWFPDPAAWPALLQPSQTPSQSNHTLQEICRRFNEGRCKHQRCKYRHACSICNGTHALIECPSRGPAGRSRSPLRPFTKGMPGQPAPRFR